jgi:hypothetical protein
MLDFHALYNMPVYYQVAATSGGHFLQAQLAALHNQRKLRPPITQPRRTNRSQVLCKNESGRLE